MTPEGPHAAPGGTHSAGRGNAAAQPSARRPARRGDAQALWREFKRTNDPQLRNRLVLTFAPIVKSIVYRKLVELPPEREADDLLSAGIEALIKAIDRYDAAKGATLEQYLWTRIRGAVIDELRAADWAPRSLRRFEREMKCARREFSAIYHRAPSEEELADALAVSPAELRERERQLAMCKVVSLNELILEDDETVELINTVAGDGTTADPQHLAAKAEAKRHFRRAFAKLSRRHREVALLLYVKHLKLKEVGELLGISETRVCQIRIELKHKLRLALTEHAELYADVA